MSADDAKSTLLSILQARGIPSGIEDIQWAFEGETTRKEAVAWIDEYLGDATLLTRDELDLYKSIGDSTKLELSSASHDVVPLHDRDIREAIAALKSSTSAIENHAKALETQKEALLQLQNGENTSDGASRMASRYGQEKSSLNFAIEDLTFSVNEQLKESEDEATKALSQLRSQSAERLASDEQVLEALSSMSSKALSTTTTNVNHAELEKWLQALAALRAGQVRAKIDTMLVGAGSVSKEELGDEGSELQIELETLKDEIDSVVHMVIGHELRNPLMKSLEAMEKGSRDGNRAWSRYLLSTMEYLVAQLEGASLRIADLRHYTEALLELRATIDATETEVKVQDASQVSAPSRSLEVRAQPTSSSAPQTPTSSLPAALRRMNLELDTDPSALETTSHDAHSKLQAQYAATEKAFVETLGKSLAPSQQDALAILGQLYTHSQYGAVRLTDEALEKKVADLGKRIDELAPKVAAGDLR